MSCGYLSKREESPIYLEHGAVMLVPGTHPQSGQAAVKNGTNTLRVPSTHSAWHRSSCGGYGVSNEIAITGRTPGAETMQLTQHTWGTRYG